MIPSSRRALWLLLLPALLLSIGSARMSAPADAACCYFAAQEKDILQPGQKAFIQWHPDEGIEAFTVQPRFEGNALDFGMVIPTPSQPKLDEMPRDFFKDLAIYTILMPLPQAIETYERLKKMEAEACADGGGGDYRSRDSLGVRVLEAGVVGSLDYKIITAETPDGLFEWLKQNQYHYGGDETTLNHYVSKHWFFTVMKIDSKQMKKAADGSYLGEITPTRFTFSSTECIYPLRITQISVKDTTDALFYIQAPAQMDLQGDFSWMHSYRPMYLTYMLGCSADAAQQAELTERMKWLEARKRQVPGFETTKLEWAKRLDDADLSVLDDPAANYAQAGGSDLPGGTTWVSHADFVAWAKSQEDKARSENNTWAVEMFHGLPAQYPEGQGRVARIGSANRFYASEFLWCPNREAPADAVQGLTRLKGHLQKGTWLTKFRRQIRRDEMTDDMKLVPVATGQEQQYVRIMPTSPP